MTEILSHLYVLQCHSHFGLGSSISDVTDTLNCSSNFMWSTKLRRRFLLLLLKILSHGCWRHSKVKPLSTPRRSFGQWLSRLSREQSPSNLDIEVSTDFRTSSLSSIASSAISSPFFKSGSCLSLDTYISFSNCMAISCLLSKLDDPKMFSV